MKRTAGDIEYELTLKRIKNINMRVGTDGSVRVSAPYGSDREFIDRFVLSRRGFIEDARRRIGSRAPVPAPDASRLEIYKRLYAVMKSVYPRFSEYGFAMPQLRIRAMTSQWGNCRRKRQLVTLNSYLYSLPERLIEYVAAHELSHMVESNHSAAFYAVLGKAMPDYRAREKELKKYRLV